MYFLTMEMKNTNEPNRDRRDMKRRQEVSKRMQDRHTQLPNDHYDKMQINTHHKMPATFLINAILSQKYYAVSYNLPLTAYFFAMPVLSMKM